ncbi:hypothetical protein HHK36_003162 [Tetracentron sinense]|uniref:EF-hand domain-containing protein n=1 Tax=Tetracentron sinense TaxID=13715 RepID=A0A834ZNK6_TETSI|nr:hypothetical protein HHK36_003162 [Tetracentron sinense]
MATLRVPKPSKWFSNTSFKLSLSPRHPKSNTLSPPVSPPTPKESPSPVSPPTPKDDTRKDVLREVFRYFDGDGDGKISSLELREYFASIGEYMSHDAAQGVISDLDMDGDNLLDFEEFVRLMERDGGDDDIRNAFEMFEVDKGSGCITPKGLQQMLNRLGDTKSYEECVAMIRIFDLDGNGVLDFHEFNQMMT